ncbi:capsular polysaccharide biosynthesis protein [Ruminococcus sp. CAG:60]|nr:capsular polysaccharide biosynthesis protein [Ruminococcus sp. CAG:60]
MENQVTNNNDEIEIDLGEVFHLVISKLGVIILSGILLGVLSIIGTMLFITPKYESTTKIMVLNKQDNNTLTSADMQTSTQLTKDYAELIQSRTVLEGVIAQLNLDMTYKEMLQKVSVETSSDSRIVSISVTDEDPYTASEIANAVRDMAAEHIQSVMDIEAVNVVDTANIPNEKASPSLAKNGVIGGLLGVIIAMAAVIIIYLTNDTIKVEEDVERYLGLSVLGSIPFSEKESRSKKKKSRKRR